MIVKIDVPTTVEITEATIVVTIEAMTVATVDQTIAVTVEAPTATTVYQMTVAAVKITTNVATATKGRNGASGQMQNQRSRSKKRWRICADYTYSKSLLPEG